jgi:hypothetical protein
MYIDSSRSDDFPLTRDNLCTGSNDHVFGYSIHRIGITSFSNPDNQTILDTDISLDDTTPIDNDCVCNDSIKRFMIVSVRRLTLSFSEGLSTTEFTFVSIYRVILFNLDP